MMFSIRTVWAIDRVPAVLTLVLLAAAAGKAADLGTFAGATSMLRPIPVPLRQTLPLAVPISELVIACLITAETTRHVGMSMMLALLIVFTTVLAWQALHPFAGTCACFGVIPDWAEMSGVRFGILRNAVLMAAIAVWLPRFQSSKHEGRATVVEALPGGRHIEV